MNKETCEKIKKEIVKIPHYDYEGNGMSRPTFIDLAFDILDNHASENDYKELSERYKIQRDEHYENYKKYFDIWEDFKSLTIKANNEFFPVTVESIFGKIIEELEQKHLKGEEKNAKN